MDNKAGKQYINVKLSGKASAAKGCTTIRKQVITENEALAAVSLQQNYELNTEHKRALAAELHALQLQDRRRREGKPLVRGDSYWSIVSQQLELPKHECMRLLHEASQIMKARWAKGLQDE